MGFQNPHEYEAATWTTMATATPTLAKNPVLFSDIMRADVDGDGGVSILDLTIAAQKFAQNIPPAPERLNQDAALSISILDLTKMALVFTQNVSACA